MNYEEILMHIAAKNLTAKTDNGEITVSGSDQEQVAKFGAQMLNLGIFINKYFEAEKRQADNMIEPLNDR